jgi:hypothetical protein
VTLKDIDEDVNIAIAAFQTWLNCVRAPIAACRSLVSRDLSDEHKMILGMRVWVVATLFGLICEITVFGLLGIKWANLTFLLPYNFFLLLMFVTGVAAIEVGFRVFKIESNFPDTLVLYSIVIGSYSPLILLVNLPGFYDSAAMKQVKAPDVGLLTVLDAMTAKDHDQSLVANVHLLITGPIATLLNFVLTILFGYCAAALYQVSRPKVLAAVGFSLGTLFVLPAVLFGLLYYVILYVTI